MNYCKKRAERKLDCLEQKAPFNGRSSSAVAVKRKGCIEGGLFWLFAALIHMFGESISAETEVVQCSRSFSCTVIVLLICVCKGFDK